MTWNLRAALCPDSGREPDGVLHGERGASGGVCIRRRHIARARHLEVKALDTAALDNALAAAKTQLDTLTDSEDAALADNAKIFVAANGVTADSVTKGVKFIERSQTATLKDAYAAAQSKQNSGSFTSQTECDRLAQELRRQATRSLRSCRTWVRSIRTR